MRTHDFAELSSHVVYLRSLGYRTARDYGLASREYDLLLAIKTLPPATPRCIGELASWLCMQQHGVVELATRLERRHLLRRYHDQRDGRCTRLALTSQGARVLRRLVTQESERLRSSAADAVSGLKRIIGEMSGNGNGAAHKHNRNITASKLNGNGRRG